MSEENQNTAAARRRAAKQRPSTEEKAVAEAEVNAPRPEPVHPMAIDQNKPIIVSRAMVAQYAATVPTGLTGARIPAADMPYGRGNTPAVVPVQPSSNSYGTLPNEKYYVAAEYDADESMLPEGCKTPVSRVLWRKGWRVRRDLYEAVMAKTGPADQAAAAVSPAKLPDGVTEPPAGMLTEVASPTITAPPGAPA